MLNLIIGILIGYILGMFSIIILAVVSTNKDRRENGADESGKWEDSGSDRG